MSKAAELDTGAEAAPAAAGWRFKLGTAIFLVSLGWPLLVPAMPFLGFSGAMIAAFLAVMVVVGEVLILVAVAVMGKPGFAFMKSKVFGVLKRYGPPKTVGRVRYRIGLVMFTVPILFGWAEPYVSPHLSEWIPFYDEFVLAIALDAMLVLGLFVLGGEFWDKLRSLFLHGARAIMPEKPVAESTA